MSDLIDDNLALIERLTRENDLLHAGETRAQCTILELEIVLRQEKDWHDALAVRLAQATERIRELERKIAVRDELDQLEMPV